MYCRQLRYRSLPVMPMVEGRVRRYSANPFEARYQTEVDGQHNAQAALTPGMARYPFQRSMGEPWSYSGQHKKSIRSPDRPACSESLSPPQCQQHIFLCNQLLPFAMQQPYHVASITKKKKILSLLQPVIVGTSLR